MNLLALFMKSPDSGVAKRRLRPVLSEGDIARLCEAFAEDLLEKVSLLPCEKKVIAYVGGSPEGVWANRSSLSLYAQTGRDLGERLENYFSWSFLQGADKSVVIGSDSPTLPLGYLEEAFRLLDNYEAVLGPSEDGGYYLIGMRRLHPELFRNIPWGSDRVFAETLRLAGPLKDRIGVLNLWYDVDTPGDLKRLRRHLVEMVERKEGGVPLRTHRLLSNLVF